MSHLLPLSRVAKLVGQPRHTLQEMIPNGTLATFDGMVELDELLRAFPEVDWDDDAEFRRVTEIKDKAFAKRVLERALPDKDVLVARLNELGDDYAAAKALLLHYGNVMTWLDEKIDELEENASVETHHALHTLRAFLLRNLAETPPDAVQAQAAIAQERIFKLMSAHVTIQPSGHEFFVDGNDTLLDAALRNGVSLSYGCSNGNCGECKARVVAGDVKKVHAHDYVLKQTEKDAGMILLCAYAPVNDVVIEANVAGAHDIPVQQISARVKSVEVFNPQMAALHILAPRSQRLRYLGGHPYRDNVFECEARAAESAAREICSARLSRDSLYRAVSFFTGFAGVGVDPVGYANFVLGFFHRLAWLKVAFGIVFHVLYGFQYAREGTIFLASIGIDPVTAIGPLDDAGVIVVGWCFRYELFHCASSVPQL